MYHLYEGGFHLTLPRAYGKRHPNNLLHKQVKKEDKYEKERCKRSNVI